MHKKVVLLFIAFAYFVLALVASYSFNLGYLTASVLLFGFPAFALARLSLVPAPVLISVSALGLGVGLILEMVAITYGLWSYNLPGSFLLFNLIPVDVIASSVMFTVLLVFIYEISFDNRGYSTARARDRLVLFIAFAALSVLFAVFGQHVLLFGDSSPFVLSFSLALLVFMIGVLVVSRTYSVMLFRRLIQFSSTTAVLLFSVMMVEGLLGYKVYHLSKSVGGIEFNDFALPFEQLVLAFVIPFVIASIYEMYLDDRV